ncbi:hypothetical protein N7517_004865 [Penicillium concentricum]|uniref:Uncharacterized protein n=1 Tax=Penicillium concentricum TaxID=293559 RepID=A0A9W9S922_9EURO|nr:uncharacterized protein N7517_004865 [Penicillium concentricum]KAJ5372859.1 hypothetical protein N7517_004865 [Penicillium concentricum]
MALDPFTPVFQLNNAIRENACQPSADDPSLWVDEVGPILTSMLVMAGYSSYSTLIHMKFFQESVARSLGPHPRGRGPGDWKSFMTDDHTPVELSWCWSTSTAHPAVRYSVEPIGSFAGQEFDPTNTTASLRLLEDASPLATNLDLYLHNHFESLLLLRNEQIERIDNQPSLAPQSQSFLAFDLLETLMVVKQYYLPERRALSKGKQNLEIIKYAIQKLPPPANALTDSIDMFNEFYDSFQEHSQPAVEIMAIDCVDPCQSRLKIYIRSHLTTLESVVDILSLGGRAPKTEDEEESLRELWCSVFGLNANNYHKTQPLREMEHRTGGILYYFELKRGTKAPKSKVYLPVRHYAHSDEQISRGLSDYLARRGKTLATGSYYDGVKSLCNHRDLANGLGFHTYICWASDKGHWNVTAYFNPEIYHQSRSTSLPIDQEEPNIHYYR